MLPHIRDRLVPPRTQAVAPRRPLPRRAPPPKATHEVFEKMIREAPDDPDAYLVYADWLQAQHDPRGELIVAQAQRAADPESTVLADAERALLRKHGTYFVPEALARALKLPKSRGPRCEIQWRNGFFARVRLVRDATPTAKRIDLDVVARAVLGHPSARFLRSLEIGPLGTRTYVYEPIVRAIASRPHPLLAELHIGDFGPTDSALAPTRVGDITALFATAPALQRLVVKGDALTLTAPITHATLRELSMTTTRLSATSLDALRTARLPALASLTLATDGLAATELAPIVEPDAFPALRRLVVPNTTATGALVRTLLASRGLARLEDLDLSGGDLDDRTASEMMGQREKLAHLRRLDVTSARLSPDWARRLATATGAVVIAPRPTISDAEVVRRSPDTASLAAARKIAVPAMWLALGYDRRRHRVWGEYEGRDHYCVYAELRDRAVGCDCASPKHPCKHALALLLLAAQRHDFPEAPIPDEVGRRASPWRPSYGRED